VFSVVRIPIFHLFFLFVILFCGQKALITTEQDDEEEEQKKEIPESMEQWVSTGVIIQPDAGKPRR
jgi:hypothetical protein